MKQPHEILNDILDSYALENNFAKVYVRELYASDKVFKKQIDKLITKNK